MRRVFPTLIVVILAVLAALYFKRRVDLPEHLLGHEAVYVPEMFNEEVAKELLRLAKEDMGEFPTNAADVLFYKTLHEHIGEGRPLVNGSCPHPFLIPNRAGDLCVLAGRIDIGRHFILSGGYVGLKEWYEDAVTRLQSFGRYIFDLKNYPLVGQLFESEQFQQHAKTVCPKDKQVLDPFQFNFIVQLPGQTVALHVDAVYFWGASRFQFPQWLLAVMQFSGLFQEEFIDQVQVVGYFHEWNNTESRSGDFVYWQENVAEPLHIAPYARSGSVVDGSKVVHAGSLYRPGERPPRLDKSQHNSLHYIGDDKWELRAEGKNLKTYVTDDLRWTIVYRARCFRSDEEVEKYHNMKDEEMMKLDTILARFADDLSKRGLVTSPKAGLEMDRLEFSELLLDTYVKYPLPPSALIPYNYCALPRKWKWTEFFLKPFC